MGLSPWVAKEQEKDEQQKKNTGFYLNEMEPPKLMLGVQNQ